MIWIKCGPIPIWPQTKKKKKKLIKSGLRVIQVQWESCVCAHTRPLAEIIKFFFPVKYDDKKKERKSHTNKVAASPLVAGAAILLVTDLVNELRYLTAENHFGAAVSGPRSAHFQLK